MKKKLTITVLIIAIMIVIVFFGRDFLIKNNNHPGLNLNVTNSTTNQEIVNGADNLHYNDQQDISFDCPSNYFWRIEDKNLPPSIKKNIYLMNIKDEDQTDPFRVQISIFKNPDNLSIEKYLDDQKEKGVIVLPGGMPGSPDYDQVSTRKVGNNDITEYTSQQTGERSAFLSGQGKIIVVQEFGDNQEIKKVHELVLRTILLE